MVTGPVTTYGPFASVRIVGPAIWLQAKVAHEEFEGLANDLARALVVVTGVKALLAGRMIEHGQIEASLTSSAHECVGAFKDRGAIPARAREQERRQMAALRLERRQAA